MEFLYSFLKRHFAEKLVAASNVGCFLRLLVMMYKLTKAKLKKIKLKKFLYNMKT